MNANQRAKLTMGDLTIAIWLIGALSLSAIPAHAIEIDFSAPILDLSGTAIPDGKLPDGKDGPAITLGRIAAAALCAEVRDTEHQAERADSKRARCDLGMALYKGGIQDRTPDDLTLAKKYIGLIWPPLYVSRAFSILDAKGDKK